MPVHRQRRGAPPLMDHTPFRASSHSVSKTKRKEVLIGARGCVMHTGLSELFLSMCRSASALSRSAWMHIFMGVLDPCTAGPP